MKLLLMKAIRFSSIQKLLEKMSLFLRSFLSYRLCAYNLSFFLMPPRTGLELCLYGTKELASTTSENWSELVCLIMLRKAMDMKAAATVHSSNSPLPAKPGEKKDLFLSLDLLLKDLGIHSAVRVASGKMKMRKLSRGVSTP